MNYLEQCSHVRVSSDDKSFIVHHWNYLAENDWRLAQYLIRHKQCPSFSPSPQLWSESSISNPSTSAPPPLFLPTDSSSSSESESLSSDSDSDSDDDDDEEEEEEEEEENNLLVALRETQQPSPLRLEGDDPLRPSFVTMNSNPLSTEQRSQITSNFSESICFSWFI